MMSMSKGMKYVCIIILFFASFTALGPTERSFAFTNQVIQKGSTGYDVVELQARLQYIGYYRGPIDGVFGWNTYWALRNFQKKFGLKQVDGLAGLKTRQMLVAASEYDEQWVREQIRKGRKFTYYGGTPKDIQSGPPPERTKEQKREQEQRQRKQQQQKQQPQQNRQAQQQKQPARQPGQVSPGKVVQEAQNVPEGFSQNDINLMANAVHGEARGESYIGQVAIAAVILNRVNSPKFPNTVTGVIFEPGAFTAVADGQIWLTPDQQSKKAVLDALNGWDPSGGALYYFNPVTATSDWIWSRPQIKKIGKHIFGK